MSKAFKKLVRPANINAAYLDNTLDGSRPMLIKRD